jgi:tetratricopeptide (TPR) repeat protein
MGDRRYAERAWQDAVAEYRLAVRQRGPSPERLAKLALAALNAGAVGDAVDAYRQLAGLDPSAAEEAADGLVRAARRALDQRDVAVLRKAVAALREVAPGRTPGALGLPAAALVSEGGGESPELVLAAAAASPSRRLADSLLFEWAMLESRAGRCRDARLAFEAVIRRGGTPTLERASRAGISNCAVQEGRASLAEGDLEEAEVAFRRAIALGIPDSTVRLAWVLVGDARWAGGDSTGALEAYGKATEGGEPDDPLVVRALEQIRRLTGGGNQPE